MERIRIALFEKKRYIPSSTREKAARAGRLLYLSLWKFNRDFCFDRAASLAFATIISLIPLAVLFVSFVGLLGGGEEIIRYVQDKVFPVVAPEFQDQLVEWLEKYISPTAFRAGPAGLINLAAVVGLVMAALNILITAERVFNHIWRAKGTRHYFQKVTAFWVLLTSSPFLILASIWVGNLIAPKGGVVENFLNTHWWAGAAYGGLAPLLVEATCFTLIYLFLPSTRVQIRSAVAAGLSAAVLWEFSKRAFYLYVARAVTVTNFYKQLATVPLFFLWLFLTWIILLWGCQLAYAIQNFKTLSRLQEKGLTGQKYSLPFLGLTLLFSIHETFMQGEDPPTLEELSDRMEVPVEELEELATIFCEEGILVEDGRDPGRYVLKRHPATIAVDQVVRYLFEKEFPAEAQRFAPPGTAPSPEENPADVSLSAADALFRRAYGELMNVFAGKTLDEAVCDPGLARAVGRDERRVTAPAAREA
ncbi:YihY/virulence factor BrkB family protein [Desulfacinum hydrothermale]|uniref:YihY/virulence factor BrkB family protein n=1 Tax=Desulfacinum hydrothermale TaxID=109258 RepID=UPI001482B543|nr:YihY/virulence factor BrkB family protein [Desulfacinum hydrothermale]